MDEREIREKAKIYTKEPLKPYFKRINEAAGDICVRNPAILFGNKGDLLEMARKLVHDDGYQYKKKRSRSKSFGSVTDFVPKRPKVNKELRTERITHINEEVQMLNTQISFKEKRVDMGIAQKNFKLCDQLSDEISNLQQKRRELQAELKVLAKKEKRADTYQFKKKLSNLRSSATPLSSDSDVSSEPSTSRRASFSPPFVLPSPTSAPITFSGKISSISEPTTPASHSSTVTHANPPPITIPSDSGEGETSESSFL